MVTAGTYRKTHLFDTPEKRDMLMSEFFRLAKEFDWQPQAWAFMSNHYHVVMLSPKEATGLPGLLKEFHRATAMRLNRTDKTVGRQVWFQYWDKQLTFHESYCARLRYVHENPVHHGVVRQAEEYRWCSAHWFARLAEPAFQRMINSFKTDKLKECDEFGVVLRSAVQAGRLIRRFRPHFPAPGGGRRGGSRPGCGRSGVRRWR